MSGPPVVRRDVRTAAADDGDDWQSIGDIARRLAADLVKRMARRERHSPRAEAKEGGGPQ